VTILDVLTSLTSLQNARDEFQRAELQVKLNRISLGVAINEFSGDKIRKLQVSTNPAAQ
jgi:outer membrane protein TolC